MCYMFFYFSLVWWLFSVTYIFSVILSTPASAYGITYTVVRFIGFSFSYYYYTP